METKKELFMKTLFKVAAIAAFIFAGCKNFSAEKITDFIPGVYVKHIQGEYSEGYDTLQISKVIDDADSYTVIRNTTYQRMINGKIKPPEHKTEKWFTLYDEKSKVLVEQKKGKILSFIPEKNQLLVGSSAYEKIKAPIP